MAGKDGSGSRFLGTLREALAAAGKEDTAKPIQTISPAVGRDGNLSDQLPGGDAHPAQSNAGASGGKMSDERTQPHHPSPVQSQAQSSAGKSPSAAEAAREARGGTPNIPPVPGDGRERHVEYDSPPTTRVVRGSEPRAVPTEAKTQMLRGKQPVQRGAFSQDPVVGWLVVVGGPGLGSYRPIFEGNNTLGRSSSQRIPIDFGDDAISAEEQCYVRYDSAGRSFLFVPNLAKANVVSVNEARPTGAVQMQAMDVITVGRTQLVFIPFCGAEFDWSDVEQAS